MSNVVLLLRRRRGPSSFRFIKPAMSVARGERKGLHEGACCPRQVFPAGMRRGCMRAAQWASATPQHIILYGSTHSSIT